MGEMESSEVMIFIKSQIDPRVQRPQESFPRGKIASYYRLASNRWLANHDIANREHNEISDFPV